MTDIAPLDAMKLAASAQHRAMRDIPFVPISEGVELQLLMADVQNGLWVVRQKMRPGVTLPTHRHTGSVHAFTLSGAWKYLEQPDVNHAGSYLFEPAGSVHTLHTPASNDGLTDVWFAIHGANLNLDTAGHVTEVLDASGILRVFLSRCIQMGLPKPPLVGADTEPYWTERTARHSAMQAFVAG